MMMMMMIVTKVVLTTILTMMLKASNIEPKINGKIQTLESQGPDICQQKNLYIFFLIFVVFENPNKRNMASVRSHSS